MLRRAAKEAEAGQDAPVQLRSSLSQAVTAEGTLLTSNPHHTLSNSNNHTTATLINTSTTTLTNTTKQTLINTTKLTLINNLRNTTTTYNTTTHVIAGWRRNRPDHRVFLPASSTVCWRP